MPIYAIDDLIPVIRPGSFVHPSADIIGDVIIEEHCYIGPGASLRGDFGRIYVSHHSNVQDNCVLHSFPNKDCVLKPYSHIGHASVLHGCTIGKNVLVGMNSVIMDDAAIGDSCIIAACSFIKSKFHCDEKSLIVGTPAKVLRALTDDEVNWKTQGTEEYVQLTQRCLASLREVIPLNEEQTERPRFELSSFTTKGS